MIMRYNNIYTTYVHQPYIITIIINVTIAQLIYLKLHIIYIFIYMYTYIYINIYIYLIPSILIPDGLIPISCALYS